MFGGFFLVFILSDDDTSSVEVYEYYYILEDLINLLFVDFIFYREKLFFLFDFLFRIYNISFFILIFVISQFVLNDSCLLDKDRLVSVVSVFSS